MTVELSPLQKHVDSAIDARITSLSRASYVRANRLPSGRMRKTYVPYSMPQEVTTLLELRQRLYAGEDAEGIMAQVKG